ncbi:GIY-YIG nuclease family protein [Echinicola marina]|uniref:GIY-YIG nuclease family protein n=1 Tax=Echinicola marina TaxID=2859768 RepID=UPI001CF70FBF|nr:GIY-YIG nuclease family protein [Echinicola marina]UCS92667.1 GIY-YIG nuclease family protein [Echinicola marina]
MDELFTVYVLFTKSSGKTYTGMTSNLTYRFHSHNTFAKKGFTTRYRPWTVIHTEIFFSKPKALQREKELKTGNGRIWIKTNILPKYL